MMVETPPSLASDAGEDGETLRALLDRVDAAALAVYAFHQLPSRPGHYRQAPGLGTWEHLGNDLTPAQKWALMDVGPTEQGWRYSSLEQLGARSPVADVRYASSLLAACQGLRQRLDEGAPLTAQDVADAIQLGAAWRRLSEVNQTRSHLKFLAPDEG